MEISDIIFDEKTKNSFFVLQSSRKINFTGDVSL